MLLKANVRKTVSSLHCRLTAATCKCRRPGNKGIKLFHIASQLYQLIHMQFALKIEPDTFGVQWMPFYWRSCASLLWHIWMPSSYYEELELYTIYCTCLTVLSNITQCCCHYQAKQLQFALQYGVLAASRHLQKTSCSISTYNRPNSRLDPSQDYYGTSIVPVLGRCVPKFCDSLCLDCSKAKMKNLEKIYHCLLSN